LYPARQLPAFEAAYQASGGKGQLASYVTAAYDRIAVTAALRRRVLFFQHDLVSDHVFGEMHLVLCRNVLIYFGRELRERVLGKLAASVRPGGFLALGASEQLPRAGRHAGVFDDFAAAERIYRHAGRAG